MVLGRIAVIDGRIADAGRFLAEAGNTPGSPQLNSFGPNMTLARDLLQRGETVPVLAYFEQVRRFWKMGGERLDAWSAAVEAGRDAQVPIGGNAWQLHLVPLSPLFRVGLSTDVQLIHEAFEGLPLLQLEFEAEVPWVLQEPFTGSSERE